MTLIRWNPMRDVNHWHPVSGFGSEFVNMQREIDRFFDGLHGGISDDGRTSTWLPPVDIKEGTDNYLVRVELPGMDKDDVKITLQDDVLTIKGEKKQEAEQKGESFNRVERSYGLFQRSFTLGSSVKSDKIEASYDKGVLTIQLPKVEDALPKEIDVKIT